jgi:hypothetical protein
MSHTLRPLGDHVGAAGRLRPRQHVAASAGRHHNTGTSRDWFE